MALIYFLSSIIDIHFLSFACVLSIEYTSKHSVTIMLIMYYIKPWNIPFDVHLWQIRSILSHDSPCDHVIDNACCIEVKLDTSYCFIARPHVRFDDIRYVYFLSLLISNVACLSHMFSCCSEIYAMTCTYIYDNKALLHWIENKFPCACRCILAGGGGGGVY